MAEVTISINGRPYEIACDNGQEGRVQDIAAYVDQRVQDIARSGAAYNDSHLLVLAALVLGDELFEQHENPQGRTAAGRARAPVPAAEDEKSIVTALEQLAKRIESIAARVQAA